MFSVHSVNPGRAWYPFLFIASESVHVVSLQALKTPGQTTQEKTAITTKTTPGTFSLNEGSPPSWAIVFYFISTCQNVKKRTESRRKLGVYYLELDGSVSVQYASAYVRFIQSQWIMKPRTSVSGSCLPSRYSSPGFIRLLKWGRSTRR